MSVNLSLVLSAEANRHVPFSHFSNIVQRPSDDGGAGLLQHKIEGGFLGGAEELVWRSYGPTVEVLEASSGIRIAAWTFGVVLKNLGYKILSVCSVGGYTGHISHIVCGLDTGSESAPQGLIAVLSIATSKIVRAFACSHAVAQLTMVTGGDQWVDSCTLDPAYRIATPLLCFATKQPSIHLLDLALDITEKWIESDEVSPASFVTLPPLDNANQSAAFRQHRLATLRQGMHCLDSIIDGSLEGNRFRLLGPSNSVLCQLPASSARVTALAYVPQLASLAIGYNFGSFQLYNLHARSIDCTSPYEEEVPAVVSFAYQEPENDPRNYVYLWLCRSVTPSSPKEKVPMESSALCTLYSMSYEKREWIEGHGLWYQGLSAISPRFEFELVGNPCPSLPSLLEEDGSVMFSAVSVRKQSPSATPPPLSLSPPSPIMGSPEEESSSGTVSDLTLCLFGWSTRGKDTKGRATTLHHVALFDINQWYQAEMPSSLQFSPGRLCSYLSFHRLDRVPCEADGMVLSCAPLSTSNFVRHVTTGGTNEKDWFPAALSYNLGILTTNGSAWYLCRSSQQWCLRWLVSQGPAAVLCCPQEAVLRCAFAGLLPSDVDVNIHADPVSAREAVLTVCLNHHLSTVLTHCISEFSEGRFAVQGCTLPSLLSWLWQKVTSTKQDNDQLLSVVFSRKSCRLSSDELQRLHQNLTVLNNLKSLLAVCVEHTPITTRHAGGGKGEVTAYTTVVTLLYQHLIITLWFLHCNLLPEVDPKDAVEDSNAVPYPAAPLTQIYANRRRDISKLNSSLKGSEILLIDELMLDLGVKEGLNGWGGEGEAVLYPPPSLQALLNLYLLPDKALPLKHRIVQYLFMDLSSILTDGFSSAVEQLIKFPASAKLSPSVIKLTQAFWLLDQKDFQGAVSLFMDPLVVRTDITIGQHRRILRALLFQNEPELALTYLNGRSPPQQQLEDIQLHLSVLLANGRVREAFHYQRQHGTVKNARELLDHLLQGCEYYSHLGDILQLPLLPSEKDIFVSFLKASNHPNAKDVYTLWCLSNACYSEMSSDNTISMPNEKESARSALIHAYTTHLPFPALQNKQPSILSGRHMYSAQKPLSAQLKQMANTKSPSNKSKLISRFNSTPEQLKPQVPFTPFRSYKASDCTRNLSSVLFPSRIEIKKQSFSNTSVMNSLNTEMPSNLLSASYDHIINKSSLKHASPHITSLLKTPPVSRRTLHSATITNATPQSILKVRTLVQRPMSPCTGPADELTLPPLPPSTPRLAKVVSEEPLTPKQLRFALPSALQSQSLKRVATEESQPSDDDHSDLDVQLEPYINKSGYQFEEQESFEPPATSKKSSEMVTLQPSSFAEVLQRSTADNSCDKTPEVLETSDCSDGDHFYSFNSEENTSRTKDDKGLDDEGIEEEDSRKSSAPLIEEQEASMDVEEQEVEKQEASMEVEEQEAEEQEASMEVEEQDAPSDVLDSTGAKEYQNIEVEEQASVDGKENENIICVDQQDAPRERTCQTDIEEQSISTGNNISVKEKVYSSVQVEEQSSVESINHTRGRNNAQVEGESIEKENVQEPTGRVNEVEEQSSVDSIIHTRKNNAQVKEQSTVDSISHIMGINNAQIEEQISEKENVQKPTGRVNEVEEQSIVDSMIHTRKNNTQVEDQSSEKENVQKPNDRLEVEEQSIYSSENNVPNVQIEEQGSKECSAQVEEQSSLDIVRQVVKENRVTSLAQSSIVTTEKEVLNKSVTYQTFHVEQQSSLEVISEEIVPAPKAFENSTQKTECESSELNKTVLSEISVDEVVECLQEKPLANETLPCITFSDSDNDSYCKSTTKDSAKKVPLEIALEVEETIKPLRFSSSDEEEELAPETKKQSKKQRQKKKETVNLNKTTDTVAPLRFSDESGVDEDMEIVEDEKTVTTDVKDSDHVRKLVLDNVDDTINDSNLMREESEEARVENTNKDDNVEKSDEVVDDKSTAKLSIVEENTNSVKTDSVSITPEVNSTPVCDSPVRVTRARASTPARESTPSRELRSPKVTRASTPAKNDSTSKRMTRRSSISRDVSPELEQETISPSTPQKTRDATPMRDESPAKRLKTTNAPVVEELVKKVKTPIKTASPSRSKRRLSDIATTNIFEGNEVVVAAPVTPSRRSSRRRGLDSPMPVLAKDVAKKILSQDTDSITKLDEALTDIVVPKKEVILSEDKSEKTAEQVEEVFTDNKSVLDTPIASPVGRKRRRSSIASEAEEVLSESLRPTTPLRRSSRRSMTPSKIVETDTISSPSKGTPTRRRLSLKGSADIEPSGLSSERPSTPAKTTRRKSIGTPDKNTSVLKPATPKPKAPLDAIDEDAAEEEASEPERPLTPLQLITGKNIRKSKRMSVAPSLLPISEEMEKKNEEDEEDASSVDLKIDSDDQQPNNLQEDDFSSTDDKLPKHTQLKSFRKSRASIASSRASMAFTSELADKSTKSTRTSKREPSLRKSIQIMKLQANLDLSDDSTASNSPRRRRRKSEMPEGGTADILVNADDSASEVDTYVEEDFDAMADYSGSEEGVPPKGYQSTKLKKLSSTLSTTLPATEGKTKKKSRKSVVSGFTEASVGGGVGLKRRRETMTVIVSNDSLDDSDVPTRAAKRRKSSAVTQEQPVESDREETTETVKVTRSRKSTSVNKK